jgi:single-stranded-DNA-specific exonuclease
LVIGKSQRDGLISVLEAGGVNRQKLSCQDVAFTIGPRINAAGRLEHPDFAFNTFAKTGVEALASAKELERINRRRKTITAGIMKKVYAKLDKRELGKVVVIGDKE